MPTIGSFELILILVIVAMLFGVGKLPEVFGAVGKGIREFRQNAGDPSPQHHGTTTVGGAATAGGPNLSQLPRDEDSRAQSTQTEEPQQPRLDQTRPL